MSREQRFAIAAAVGAILVAACGLELDGIPSSSRVDAGIVGADGGDASFVDGPECVRDDECNGYGNTCYVSVTCVAGRCEFQLKAPGAIAPSATQIPGDCARLACDGFGGLTTFNDDTDVPSDMNECTLDLCVDGQPHPTHPALGNGTPCGDGGTCLSGMCSGEAPTDAGPDAEPSDSAVDAEMIDSGDVSDAGTDASADANVDAAEADAG